MLNYSYVSSRPAPYWAPARALPSPRVRSARLYDWPGLRGLLLTAGVSLTGLAECFETLLVLERNGHKGAPGEILGCVAVEPGPLALVRTLALAFDDPAPRYETLLLMSALQLAETLGAAEAVLLVETTAQLPVHHQGLVLWAALRKRCPESKLVRELSGIDSMALAVRLAPPQMAKWCAIR